jgi:hypothetical protein
MKVKSTLLYGASGSFEELTIKKWKKLRVAAHKASGNFSNITQRYKDQQTAMALTVALFKNIAAAIYKGWVESKSFPGEYAAFVGNTLKHAISFVTPGSPSLTYASVTVAKGSMPVTFVTVTTADVSDNVITTTWDPTVGYKQAGTDLIGQVIYNTTQSKYLISLGAAMRSDGTVSITPPAGFLVAADSLNVKTFFYGDTSTDTAGTASDNVTATKSVTA